MKLLSITILFIGVFLAFAQEDGKTLTSTSTIRPYTWTPRAWTDQPWRDNNRPHNWNWNTEQRWNTDPRHNVDPRFNYTGYNNWNRPTWNRAGVYGDYRTIRLDEKADFRGYQYVYETVGGVNAEEIGTFDNIGLRHEGQKINGQVIITDRDGVLYKINYQVESREAYVNRGSREAERVPPTIARLLALMESHK